MNTKEVLVPDYFEEFMCDSTQCSDSCCKGRWTVYVDEKHYKMWEKEKHPVIKSFFENYLVKNDTTNLAAYGIMRFDDDKRACHFLNSDEMCNLQINYGFDYLCDVCKRYPRICSLVYGELEKSLSLSCPVACKLVLSRQNGIKFKKIIEKFDSIPTLSQKFERDFNSSVGRFNNEVLSHIRMFCVEIIKSRTLPLWKRLMVLGMFVNDIKPHWESSNINGILFSMDKYTKEITSDCNEIDKLSTLNKSIKINLDIFDMFMNLRAKFGINESSYIKVINKAVEGLKILDEYTAQMFEESYNEAKMNWFDPFFESNTYLIENYLLNQMMISIFPFSNKNIWDSYVNLVLNYSTLKILLVGICSYYKESMSFDKVVETVQPYVKSNENHRKFQEMILEKVKENGFDSLAHMAVLTMN